MTNAISLIFYIPAAEADAGKRLLRIVETIVPGERINIHRTIQGFSGRFMRPTAEPMIAVIFISSREDLGEIIAMRDLLQEIPLVLILPDNDRDMVAKAHSLRPRFLTYTDSDAREVSGVLSRMMGKLGRELRYGQGC